MKILKTLLLALAAAAAYLLLWPIPFSAKSWTPPPAIALPPSDALRAIEPLARDVGIGPEGVAVDASGQVYAGYLDGRVMRFAANGTPTLLANTGGRPLGTLVEPDGSVIVADALKGLLRVQNGTVRVLSTESAGLPFRFVDDVDRDREGRLYFSDASSRFGPEQLMADVFEHGANGRLLRFDPASGQTETLLDGLYFANGVAVGPDDAYVLITETTEYRVTRYWLKGDKAGTREVFIDALPGFPDNISYNGRGIFWLALYAPRTADLDALLPRPGLREVIYRLPEFLHPAPVMHGWVLALDVNGRILASLQYNADDAFAPITSVEQFGDTLYFGSLSYPAYGRMPVPEALRGR